MIALDLDRFKRDIAEHAVTVIRNDGVNRHIRLSKPGTGCYHFDLVTWPGILCYTGDMGTFVFQRLTEQQSQDAVSWSEAALREDRSLGVRASALYAAAALLALATVAVAYFWSGRGS